MATEKTSQAPIGAGRQSGSSHANSGPTATPNQSPAVDADKIRAQLRLWQDRVLDLTKSNPLLGLNRSRVAKLEVNGPDAQALFVRLALEEAELKMPLVRKVAKHAPDSAIEADADPQLSIEAGDVEFVASPVELLRRMRRIYDNARTTVEERGLTTLYLTFGTLCWRDELFGDSVSPLWMVPCQLTSRGPDAPLRLSLSDEEMQLNPALEYCLRERHKTSLPELPEEPDEGSLTEFLAGIRRAVSEQGWEVKEDVWLSTFTFESLVIYQDLKAMGNIAVTSKVIAALARASVFTGQSEALASDLDGLAMPDVIPIPVLPTDSSQLDALTHAALERHVVIHGPPGTGKSQTISNLIANALAHNKKVLFVSAKMAALNVVYDRLKDLGLGRFCLEAHSTKAGKAKIIDNLRRTLESESEGDENLLTTELQDLLRVRQQLNGYVQELHKKIGPLGLTVYKAIGKIAKLRGAPDVRAPLPWSDLLSVSQNELDLCVDTLMDLATVSGVYDGRSHHPWRGFVASRGDINEQEQLETDLKGLAEGAGSLLRHLQTLSFLFPDQERLTFSQLENFREPLESMGGLERLPHQWWLLSAAQLDSISSRIEGRHKLVTEFNEKRRELAALLDCPFREVRDFLSPIESNYAAWYQRLSPGFRSWRAEFKRRLKSGAKASVSAARSSHALATRLVDIQTQLDNRPDTLGTLTPERLNDANELQRAAMEFRVASLLHKALDTTGLKASESPTELTVAIRTAAAQVAIALPSQSKAIVAAIESLEHAWLNGFVESALIRDTPLCSLIARTAEVLSALGKMRDWVLLERKLKKCQTLGLAPFINGSGDTGAQVLRLAFERRFYTLWTSAAVGRAEELAEFTGGRRHDLIEKFRILDSKIQRLAIKKAQAVASQASYRIRAAQDYGGNTSEVGILRYELQKKKRVKPLRKLFAEIPHVLQGLKPCMLMSPISVSTYLKPGAITFDLVVFDEASQLPTAEAIPSILRSSQVIVAGDSNQLPPTSFFEAALITDEEDRDEDADVQGGQEPLESLLDDCVAIVPVFQESFLRWHYRSRDERLIKFSNHFFYENRMITFPACASSGDGRGVRLVYQQDGIWDRGRSRTNRAEARTVAKLALEHFTMFPERSLGIVAMNTSQREAIEDAISEELQEQPSMYPFFDASRHERFFVKSLENVQGDERDTMIISVGYGKDSNGGLSYNFGPINTDGGWRRLNVLVTRAKWHTILVTSLRSQDLAGINVHNRGAISLRNFIEFAERLRGASIRRVSLGRC
jgi:RecA/RadA recombinase